jgi:hypothetical protein
MLFLSPVPEKVRILPQSGKYHDFWPRGPREETLSGVTDERVLTNTRQAR